MYHQSYKGAEHNITLTKAVFVNIYLMHSLRIYLKV